MIVEIANFLFVVSIIDSPNGKVNNDAAAGICLALRWKLAQREGRRV